jgi:pimeloyl-ACP methyl ester carboxylesterase
LPERRARLVERWRVDWTPTFQTTAFMRAFMEPGAFVMERKMLLGIKERVEAAGRPPDPAAMFKCPEGKAEYEAAYAATLAQAEVPIESFDVSTRFGLTRVNACGPKNAPPLVLLPGYAFSSTMWYPNFNALGREHRVYALDTVGDVGKSIYLRPISNRADYAEWLKDVFAALGLERAAVAGLSFGGFLAMNFALSAPERVDKLVLLSPAATFVALRPEFYVRSFGAVLAPVRPLIDSLAQWMTAAPIESHAKVIEQFALGLKHFRWGNQVYPSVFSDEELGGLKAPVLLVLGEAEVIYDPVQALARATRVLPNLSARILPAAGHAINLDQPEAVNDVMLQFLRSNGTALAALPSRQLLAVEAT